MKLADRILNKLGEASTDDMGEIPKEPMKVIEKMVKENLGKDNKSQMQMAKYMEALAQSDDDMANKFMEGMDNVAGAYDMADKEDGFKQVMEAIKSMKKKK